MATTLERNAKAFKRREWIECIEERMDVLAVALGLAVVALMAFALAIPG